MVENKEGARRRRWWSRRRKESSNADEYRLIYEQICTSIRANIRITKGVSEINQEKTISESIGEYTILQKEALMKDEFSFSIWSLGDELSEIMTYRFANGKVMKGGLVDFRSDELPVICYSDGSDIKPEYDGVIRDSLAVGLDELKLVAKLARDPKGNIGLVKEFPRLPRE